MKLFFDYAPIAGLIFFFTVYVLIAFRTYRPSVKATLQSYANIPFKQEANHE